MHKRSAFGYAAAVTALLGVSLGSGCGDESSVGSSDGALRGGQRADQVGAAGEGSEDEAPETDEGEAVPGQGWVPGEGIPEDFCENGGAVGRIDVAFDCDEITIITCKDLSNVVVEFEDGTRQKFDGLNGQSASFSGTGDNSGKVVVGVWVKAGANHSGDGPGYGERFDAPGEQTCDEGGDGDGDSGDGDGDACDDLDEDCGGPPPGDGDGDGDSGDGDGDSGDGDGDTECDNTDPNCNAGGDGDGDGDGDDGECDGLDEDCGGDPPPTDPTDPNFCIFEPESPLCHVD